MELWSDFTIKIQDFNKVISGGKKAEKGLDGTNMRSLEIANRNSSEMIRISRNIKRMI
jgi:hypothetical protein